MKKFLKGFLLFFCLPVAVVAAFVYGLIFCARYVERFDRSTKTEHFFIRYNGSEDGIIDDVENKLESNYARIKRDLKIEDKVSLEEYQVIIDPDLNSLHSKMMALPWWIADIAKLSGRYVPLRDSKNVGGVDHNEVIRIVSPSNPGDSGYTYDQILDVATRELTRKVARRLADRSAMFNGFGYMLVEGLAFYEANQGYIYDKGDGSFNSEVLAIAPESIYSFKNMDMMIGDNKYPVGYSFVKYVVENCGYDKVLDLLKKDYSSQEYDKETVALYDEWIKYLKSN